MPGDVGLELVAGLADPRDAEVAGRAGRGQGDVVALAAGVGRARQKPHRHVVITTHLVHQGAGAHRGVFEARRIGIESIHAHGRVVGPGRVAEQGLVTVRRAVPTGGVGIHGLEAGRGVVGAGRSVVHRLIADRRVAVGGAVEERGGTHGDVVAPCRVELQCLHSHRHVFVPRGAFHHGAVAERGAALTRDVRGESVAPEDGVADPVPAVGEEGVAVAGAWRDVVARGGMRRRAPREDTRDQEEARDPRSASRHRSSPRPCPARCGRPSGGPPEGRCANPRRQGPGRPE
jgi:hypothetical protein